METDNWRSKYQQLVREFDAAEHRWRELEHVLRRIIGRLCLAADTGEERLHGPLDALARASRAPAGLGGQADAWSGLLSELESSVTALRKGATPSTSTPAAPAATAPATAAPVVAPTAAPEATAVSAPAPTPMWQASIEAMGLMLQQLAGEFRGEAAPEELLKGLEQELRSVASDVALAAVIHRAVALVAGRADRLARERVEAAGLLERVTQRLEEISAYLEGARTDRRTVLADADRLNAAVSVQVRELSVEVEDSTDLGALKLSVGTRLDAITTKVDEFHKLEQRRYTEYQQRADQMGSRLAQLEQQACDLRRTLDDERRRARIDALTGIANRAAFDERFGQELARCSRSGGKVCVLLWDLDHFKAINDRFGHRVGDGVLREVARCLVHALRIEDFVARIGGEEFVTLMVGATAEQALARAEELRAAIAALKLHVHGTPVHVTISCGATEMRADDSAETLFDRADAALYRAKESGRNLCTAA
ncbi:MAG: GGDEF domain-containing protein [Steroidobacteraceae bacterium]